MKPQRVIDPAKRAEWEKEKRQANVDAARRRLARDAKYVRQSAARSHDPGMMRGEQR